MGTPPKSAIDSMGNQGGGRRVAASRCSLPVNRWWRLRRSSVNQWKRLRRGEHRWGPMGDASMGAVRWCSAVLQRRGSPVTEPNHDRRLYAGRVADPVHCRADRGRPPRGRARAIHPGRRWPAARAHLPSGALVRLRLTRTGNGRTPPVRLAVTTAGAGSERLVHQAEQVVQRKRLGHQVASQRRIVRQPLRHLVGIAVRTARQPRRGGGSALAGVTQSAEPFVTAMTATAHAAVSATMTLIGPANGFRSTARHPVSCSHPVASSSL